MKHCSNCGAELGDSAASFCSECGKPLQTVEVSCNTSAENEKNVPARNKKKSKKEKPAKQKKNKKEKKATKEIIDESVDDGTMAITMMSFRLIWIGSRKAWIKNWSRRSLLLLSVSFSLFPCAL